MLSKLYSRNKKKRRLKNILRTQKRLINKPLAFKCRSLQQRMHFIEKNKNKGNNYYEGHSNYLVAFKKLIGDVHKWRHVSLLSIFCESVNGKIHIFALSEKEKWLGILRRFCVKLLLELGNYFKRKYRRIILSTFSNQGCKQEIICVRFRIFEYLNRMPLKKIIIQKLL